LEKITRQSYIKIVEILKKNSRAQLTLNICASLTEQLGKDFPKIIVEIKNLAKAGQIEFTATAAYHPLLSKLPKSEMIRQIKLNSEINKKYFGREFAPTGFFPPEMAYSAKLGDVLEELGFSWVILEEYAYPGEFISREKIFKRKGKKLFVFFRERDLSLKIAYAAINTIAKLEKYLGRQLGKPGYLITAMDGETFGHHQKGLEKFLADLYKFPKLTSVKISNLSQIAKLSQIEEVEPMLSTWGITETDCRNGIVYPRWDLPDNPLHKLQWKLTNLAIKSVNSPSASSGSAEPFGLELRVERLTVKDPGPRGRQKTVNSQQFKKARNLLDKALHSDQYWWASHNPYWHYKMVVKGADMLAAVVKVSPTASKQDKIEAGLLREKIASLGLKLYGDTVINH